MERISKTRIDKRISMKRNPKLRDLIITLKKQNKLKLAALLALPKRNSVSVNLDKLNQDTKTGEIVIVPGKVLSRGNLNHKITIAAFSFSQKAKEKLKNCKITSIGEASRENFKIIY